MRCRPSSGLGLKNIDHWSPLPPPPLSADCTGATVSGLAVPLRVNSGGASSSPTYSETCNVLEIVIKQIFDIEKLNGDALSGAQTKRYNKHSQQRPRFHLIVSAGSVPITLSLEATTMLSDVGNCPKRKQRSPLPLDQARRDDLFRRSGLLTFETPPVPFSEQVGSKRSGGKHSRASGPSTPIAVAPAADRTRKP